MRSEAPEIQRAIMDRGSLAECSNPSSALVSRLLEAKNAIRSGATPAQAAAGPLGQADFGASAMLGGDPNQLAVMGGFGGIGGAFNVGAGSLAGIEEFVRMNGLDAGAAKALRQADPAVQEHVMSHGNLQECTNP